MLYVVSFLDADADQLVRAEILGDTLSEALPRVGDSASVKPRAGPNAAGVRWFVFVRDESLATAKEQFQRFLPVPPGKALWFPDGWALVLDEDLASRNARRAAGLKRRRCAENHRREGVSRMLAQMRPVAGADPESYRPTPFPY